ncbi:uncharacterized protein A4U43_C09F4700 [Asparagus officinalis]|uniref:non-specific serine/threonine protein kinase n=1 Tax=Asparagus officinalis TaxID=4686 RepID=A0A5P1E8P0_ASPOF|nr:uncharacterized protein A4U43_C09F4700 [Asparagus officinalis]
MGHNSKKKKKKSRGRAAPKDHSSLSAEDQELLSEELTALAAIFQDDIKIVTESSYTRFDINLRPYSNDMVDEDLNVSARLSIRCLPGYPHKCPKIQIVPQKGLPKMDADRLLSLLVDQATINAREGRVMIFNLVEAAQEFLSGIVPTEQSLENNPGLASTRKEHLNYKDPAGRCFSEGPYVYVSVDLYNDLSGDGASWSSCVPKATNTNSGIVIREETRFSQVGRKNNLSDSYDVGNSVNIVKDGQLFQHTKAEVSTPVIHGAMPRVTKNLNVLKEETENDDNSVSPRKHNLQAALDSFKGVYESTLEEQGFDLEEAADVGSCETEHEYLTSSSFTFDSESQIRKKDIFMIHLLRLACASKGSLSLSFPEILSELYKLGLYCLTAYLFRNKSDAFRASYREAFAHAFEERMTSSRISQFWKAISNFNEDSASSPPNSRYLNDFEEIRSLGRGGFGHVVLCKNKLDGRQYAVKKIRLKDKDVHVNEKILREVATLSRLQHQHVVRYYQAWFETECGNYHGGTICDSRTAESCSWSFMSSSIPNDIVSDNSHESTYLYIQMEYCPRTLRHDFESFNASFDKDQTYTWLLFRQIVEGLAHIHGHGIIHRDLTPSNIFFDARNEIKIGDFGLAKFLKLEQLDPDQYFPTEATEVSTDGTGQVGTFFYTAPEIEQKWPQINEKVDMYSLGVVFFELWHPFATAMERHIILSDLKQKGALPSSWVSKFPKQSAILKRLMSPSPSDRPSATELLQFDLPPRMEDEWLNDILRTIQSPDDTYVYDRVVSTIFDMNRLIAKDHHEQDGSTMMTANESSFIQYSELDTELRDNAIEVVKAVFRQHGAKRLEISPMRVLDGYRPIDRRSVKVLTSGGDMLELCRELRSPFVNWVARNQKSSFKRYEISWVYRRAVGHSTPNRFLQGDFDIIGGATALTEAEAIKVVMDITNRFSHLDSIDIRLNHGQILEAIWSWVGIASEARQVVAELLSSIGSSHPQSTRHKSNWGFIRRQLLQDLKLPEVVVDKLQTASLRFCGSADQVLARLRGALYPDKFSHRALEEVSTLLSHLRVWNIDENISLDVLMPPTEDYHRGLFFQIYLKGNAQESASEGTLLAVGGRYDFLLHQMWHEYKFNPPGAVGVSLALEKILLRCPIDVGPSRIDPSINVLVCSRGGGGLLHERMELVSELWQANIKAEFVPLSDPSLTEQYEYAADHDIKCLIIITEAGVSQTGLVRVRHLELKKEKDVERGEIIDFLSEAAGSVHTRDLKKWN